VPSGVEPVSTPNERQPANDFALPYPLQFKGSRLASGLLRLGGWRIHFNGLPAQQGVIVVYPHTSNWDFVVMMLTKWAVGVQVRFWGKDTLFRIPLFGRWLRWLGGVAVQRTAPQGAVAQVVEMILAAKRENRYFWMGLAPEGTRKAVPGWRTGFYKAALGAGVPLGLVRLDYARREVTILDFIGLTGHEVTDFGRIESVYSGVIGQVPANASPIQLLDASVPRTDTIVK
jgi:1-acyl-sn-glycerol-3-phosphate acyltransferase